MSEVLIVLIVILSLMSIFTPRRRGCGVNDLSRWKQYGGTLERPDSPGRTNAPPTSDEAVG
jgi:hypothetical protein